MEYGPIEVEVNALGKAVIMVTIERAERSNRRLSVRLTGLLCILAIVLMSCASDQGREDATKGAIAVTTGYAIGVHRERQLASRVQVEQRVYQQTGQRITEPTVDVQRLDLSHEQIRPGESVEVTTQYQAIGPSDQSPTGEMTLLRDGKEISRQPVRFESDGEVRTVQQISVPKNAEHGLYEVVLKMKHGPSTSLRRRWFAVGSTSRVVPDPGNIRAVPDPDAIRAVPDPVEIRREGGTEKDPEKPPERR